MLGGLLENASMLVGFQGILWIAVALYLFSALFNRLTPQIAQVRE